MNKIKIGLTGLGYFGTFHLKNLLKTDFEVSGIYDIDNEKAKEIAKQLGIKNYNSLTELIKDVDAIDITTPTKYHFEIIKMALESNKHIFVEKPLTANSQESEQVKNLIKNKDLILQVGHIERYNPAFISDFFIDHKIIKIEVNRLSTYNPRGTDVSVIFDLMIHDIDLVLALINSDIADIKASGVKKFGNNLEFAHASILFENGTIATLNASILHPYTERIMKIWTDKGYYELDLGNKVIINNSYSDIPDRNNNIFKISKKETKEQNNQILDELNDFHHCISKGKKPKVGLIEGHRAILVAEQILNEC